MKRKKSHVSKSSDTNELYSSLIKMSRANLLAIKKNKPAPYSLYDIRTIQKRLNDLAMEGCSKPTGMGFIEAKYLGFKNPRTHFPKTKRGRPKEMKKWHILRKGKPPIRFNATKKDAHNRAQIYALRHGHIVLDGPK